MNAHFRILAAGILFAATQLAAAATAQTAPTAAAAATRGQPAAVAEQAQVSFNSAADAYAKKDYARAADDIRKATDYLRAAAQRATGEAKSALDDAVSDLAQLSTAIDKGTVKDEKALQQSFAKADRALALAHRTDATESWRQAQSDKAGVELKAAANDLEYAAQWTGSAAKAGFASIVADTRLLGDKLAAGAHWTRGEVSHGFHVLGNALDRLGREIGVKDKTAPVS